VRTYSLSR
jgi:hypothetical protein